MTDVLGRRARVGAALVVGVLAIGGAGQAIAGNTKPTEIVVTHSNGAEVAGDTFKTRGELDTPGKCLDERKMKLVFTEFGGGKRTVDRTFSNKNGKWKMSAEVGINDESAFVKVNKGRVDGTSCGGDKTSAFEGDE